MQISNFFGSKKSISTDRTIKAQRNTLHMLCVKGISLIISMFNVPILLACFDDIEYGIWATMLSVINWIGFLDIGFEQGLRNKLSEALANNDYLLSRTLISTTYVCLFSIFIPIILLFLFGSLFIQWGNIFNTPLWLMHDVNVTFILVISIMSVSFILRVINSVNFAVQEPSRNSDILLISQTIIFILLLLFSKYQESVSMIKIGLIFSLTPFIVTSCFSVYLFLIKFPHLKPSFSLFKFKYVKQLLSVGLLFFVIQICGVIVTQSGNFIISNVLNPEEVPLFNVVNKYFSLLIVFFTIISSPYWSATTEAYVKKDFQWIKKSCKRLIEIWFIVQCVGLIMVLISPYFISVWTHYRISANFLVSFSSLLYVSFYSFSNIFITFVNGFGKIWLQLIISVALLPIGIFLSIYLCKCFGPIGVFLSNAIIYFLNCIWSMIQFKLIITNKAKGLWNR